MQSDSTEHDLIKSATDPQYADLVQEYAELGLDAIVDNELIDTIPVIKTLMAARKGVADIQDRLFLKKLAKFLAESNKITSVEREAWISRLRLEDEDGVKKAGEKLMTMVGSANDTYKAAVHGKLLRAHVRGEIATLEQLFYLTERVDMCSTNVLRGLAENREITDAALIRYGIKNAKQLTMKDVVDTMDRSSQLSRNGISSVAVQDESSYLTSDGQLLINILRSE